MVTVNPGAVPAAAEQGSHSLDSRSLLVVVVVLFFIWGGLTSLNDVLIPKLKGLFELSYTQAMLAQFAFFTAYFVMSLPAGHLIARSGFGNGIVIGLVTMAAGCLLFIPASQMGLYSAFLAALFVLAGGITILQVAANPLIARMGSPATASSRLTLAQAFNSLGTTVFPPLGSWLILGGIQKVDVSVLEGQARSDFLAREASVIAVAYFCIALVMLGVAAFFWSRRTALGGPAPLAASQRGAFALLRNARLRGGVIAIFLYVGAEVTIGSMLVSYLSQGSVLGVTEKQAGTLLALYWGGAMVGRFAGSAVLRRVAPGLVLASVCLGAVLLTAVSALTGGPLAGYALLAVGLMNAIMFPTIFTLGLHGLAERMPQGSGLLCMGIVGGALVPVGYGMLADSTGLAVALLVPVACYLWIAHYGWRHRLD